MRWLARRLGSPSQGGRFFGIGVLLAVFLLASCSSLSYYTQSLWGGSKILLQRQSIDELLDGRDVDLELRRRLVRVGEIRDFASRDLSLPDNRSYRSYVELDREHVLWNVVAAPRFSVIPREWCFPIAGCVTYRGYFSRRRAERFAERLSRRGYDVTVGGVDAYSTLGWFADPVLSTFLSRSEPALAALIFHELAHQVVYVGGDTTFNESFATAVEIEGLYRWLEERGTAAELAAVREGQLRRRALNALLLDYRGRLAELYASPTPEHLKAQRKAALFEALGEDLESTAAAWATPEAFAGWLERELNNADLASVGAYYDDVPAFSELLLRRGCDLGLFYEAAERLAGQSPEDRRRSLDRLKGAWHGRSGEESACRARGGGIQRREDTSADR